MKKLFASGLLLLLLLSSLAFALSDDEKAQKVAENAAARLGWDSPPLLNADDSIPGTSYLISYDGQGSDSEVKGYIAVLNSPLDWPYYSWVLGEMDLEHSSFHGRDAYISKTGELCNPKGMITKAIDEFVTGFVESIFGPSEEKTCLQQHGVVVFLCGKYMMMAGDETDEGGREVDVASALESAATEMGLCDYGDTVVIMAQPTDVPGAISIAKPQQLGQKVNEYYGVVSYGQFPPFKMTFLDADGSRGKNDWYTVPGTMSSYKFANGASDFDRYAADAIKEAFKGADLQQDLYLERVVIVYSGESQQKDRSAVFYDACAQHNDANFVEVDAAQGKRKVFSKNYVFLNQNRDLGTWAHEFGHSMPSKYTINGYARICDRYNNGIGQYGEISLWGLMGYGAWVGGNGEKPVHMCGFTKNAAGWLGYTPASENNSYTITSLEDMKGGDSILTLDDPTSGDANYYYIIEARDSTKVFGAVESGVMLYKVSMKDGYPVVNSIAPQIRTPWTTYGSSGGYRPTLFSTSGEGSEYTNLPGKFKVVLQSKSDGSDTVKIVPFNPRSMVGAMINALTGGISAPPGTTPTVTTPRPDSSEPKPDTDLHAYDASGNHVGMNYQTGIYENNIQGAIASGDLSNDEEWIFVPEGTQVRFEVSTYDTQKFLDANPSYASLFKPYEISVSEVKYDSSGQRYEADGGKVNVAAGQTAGIKSPSDSSLSYAKKDIMGFGQNKLCGILFAFPLIAALALLYASSRGKA